MFLLIFAAAVTSIAAQFGFAKWEDLMPYGVGAFFRIRMCWRGRVSITETAVPNFAKAVPNSSPI